MPSLAIDVRSEIWPLREAFTISRGAKTSAHVVVVSVRDGKASGHGEAVPYARYGETVESVLAQISDAAPRVTSRKDLANILQPGAALNALDCAFWDLEAKRTGRTVAALAGLAEPASVYTAYTISLNTPETMAKNAAAARSLPILKLKLGGAGDADRMRSVRHARPDARLLIDANEAWRADLLPDLIAVAAECNVEVIEQPLPASADEALRSLPRPVPICADESVHTAADVGRLKGLYDAINIKLDKAGGLTGAIELEQTARQHGLKVMIGSMVATSLAIAPAMLLTQTAEWVDLDSPLLLARDRQPPIEIDNGLISPAPRELWG